MNTSGEWAFASPCVHAFALLEHAQLLTCLVQEGSSVVHWAHAYACFWAPERRWTFFEWLAGVVEQSEGCLHSKVRLGG